MIAMLPRDVRDLIMSFHQPNEYCELEEYLREFNNLVAGRPRTILSMLWMGWWDGLVDPEVTERWGSSGPKDHRVGFYFASRPNTP